MASLPRIITVDPTDTIPQQIRSAFSLMDRLVVQIDVPGPNEALEELERGGIDFVISAWNPGNNMQGWELAAKLKQINNDVQIMLLGDYEDTDLDEEMREQSPFVYLKRPFNIPQLINVLHAALTGGDIFTAMHLRSEESQPSQAPDLGAVPNMDTAKVDEVMNAVVYDLNPVAAFVGARDGRIVISRTTMSDMDYDYMANLIASTAAMHIDMRDLIGGNLQTLQLYDGADYDVFVLSAGLHHFLAVVFDGADGASKIGAVRRYGSKHAEDLIAILGPAAFLVQRRAPESRAEDEDEVRRISDRTKKFITQETQTPELVRADLSGTQDIEAVLDSKPEPLFEAIDDEAFDVDALLGDDFDDNVDDLFDLDTLEELASQDTQKGTLGYGEAIQLGIIDDN